MSETIFDHSPTPEELMEVIGDPAATRESYAEFQTDPDSILADLWALFQHRGDDRTAQKYRARIQDPEIRRSLEVDDLAP